MKYRAKYQIRIFDMAGCDGEIYRQYETRVFSANSLDEAQILAKKYGAEISKAEKRIGKSVVLDSLIEDAGSKDL